ncbi:hypothetical protein QFZ77_005650 [Paenibacillus sp. V4I3]|nr:hypothetical protein [Paenibacillus sp. V4I3]MDQ0887130.1 hypothetical protein [Paenibacillus sp. V4I9]
MQLIKSMDIKGAVTAQYLHFHWSKYSVMAILTWVIVL